MIQTLERTKITMGWGSAGPNIFDRVAAALIEANASDDLMRRTLGPLIDVLRNEDWDTEHDSLQRFRDDPVIVELFAERGVSDSTEAGR